MQMGFGGQNVQQQTGQFGAMQVAPMNKPPTVLTGKDLSYIKDALSWELLASKKCYHLSQIAQDREIADKMRWAAQVHEGHYRLLLNQLDSTKTLI